MNNEYIEITKFGKKVLFTSTLKDDYIFKTIEREKDFYEFELLDWLLVLPYDDGIFIDVGANLGNHTLFFSKIMGKECYSFEPNDKVYSALVENITLNVLEKNVKCFNTALGNKSGKASILSVLDNNLGSTTLEYKDNGDIDVKTLDSIIFNNQSVALIKIDVEGFEFEVLKGAKETIKTNTPILLIECADQLIINQTIDYLNEFNYEPITVFGSTPLLVFVHSSKVVSTFGQNRPNFYSELKSYTVEHEKIDRINKRYRQLSESKDSIKADLDEARKKYRFSTEQISEYKIKVSDLQNGLKLLNNQIQSIHIEKERLRAEGERVETFLKEEKEGHKESQRKLEQYREEILSKEKELIRLENDNKAASEQLSQANEKYRGSTGNLQTLERALERLKEEKGQLTAESRKAEGELKEEKERYKNLSVEIKELRNSSEKKITTLLITEKDLISAKAELKFSKERLTIEQAARKNVEKTLDKTKILLDQIQLKSTKEQQYLSMQIEKLNDKLVTKSEELRSVTDKLNDNYSELYSLEKRLDETIEEYQNTLKQLAIVTEHLNDADTKYRSVTEQIAILREQLNSEEIAHINSIIILDQTKNSLLQANDKYRFQTAQIVPKLKDEIKLNTLKMKRMEDEYKRKLEHFSQQKALAELQVAKVRATLSFQVGYQIVHGLKSWRGVLILPVKLWQIRQDFRIKKGQLAIPPIAVITATEAQCSIISMPMIASEISTPPVVKTPFISSKLLRVACIMDQFTYSSYAPECDLYQLTPEHWQNELESCQPELLFIESAWRGKDDLWGNKVGHAAKEVQDIVEWCRTRSIPTVFWNKEDPIHFETFLNTARLFDYVFTTDIDCIHRYKGALGHERVYLLPFAAQPAVNNPIEKFERKDAFCFAGAYYVRYPDRTRDLGNFVSQLAELKSVEIYDRNYGKEDPNYQFPSEYQPFIIGNLPFEEIDKAYKGYNYAINLNSIKQSQTMFARRVYELLASNTLTISNFSRGVRLMFGDLVITTDSGDEIKRRLENILNDDSVSRKYRLAALRKVMSEHTYADRLSYIVSKVQNAPVPETMPVIAMVAFVDSIDSYDRILAAFDRQHYRHKKLYLVVSDEVALPENDAPNVYRISISKADTINISDAIDTDFIAGVVSEDYYGPHYLTDIALATRYSAATVIGKAAQYVRDAVQISLQSENQRYRQGTILNGRSCAVHHSLLPQESTSAWVDAIHQQTYEDDKTLSIDEFNYCKNGHFGDTTEVPSVVDDLPNINTGISLHDLITRAEKIKPLEMLADQNPFWSGELLSPLFKMPASGTITSEIEGSAWQIISTLADGKHEYLYATRELSLSEMNIQSDIGKLYFDTTPGLNLQVTLIFMDAQKHKISHVVKAANRNQEFHIPLGTATVRLGLRVYASGSAMIRGIVWGHRPIRPSQVVGHSRHLILTNHYPSYDDLYRNGFVHSRVMAYHERGVDVDVFRLRKDETLSYHEFHNIDVITGSQEALRQLIAGGNYESILVHFLDEAMWEVLKEFVDNIRVIVWVHGAEIQPYHRRDFNYHTDDARNDAKKKSDIRMTFWRSILQPMPENLQFIFVSRYFAEEVMEDIGFRIPEAHYSIIHNPIDSDIFEYASKSVEQRKRILSIRPYASAKYANDLSVKAVLMLKDKPFFRELEFLFMGDGVLFDETLAPLQDLDNVTIKRGFLTQTEIAAMHKEYGIFLCPTRMDAQGVSRDEAMSSGLIPVTNGVTAIPEFVDETCGILAPADDFITMAEGIEKLYKKPELFSVMSLAASNRVRKQSDKKILIEDECRLIDGDKE